MRQSAWVGIWVMYLAGLNLIGCVLFAWKHVEARWGLGLFLLSAIAMSQLYDAMGYAFAWYYSHCRVDAATYLSLAAA